MRIAVLFDGAGLARLGLEQAGHDCTGFEIDRRKWQLGLYVGQGKTELADVTEIDFTKFDAVWASPPCQTRSLANGDNKLVKTTLLDWSLELTNQYLWVENVITTNAHIQNLHDDWGKLYNAAQFTKDPLQNRPRIIGGRHPHPYTFRRYQSKYPGICPCITATEYKGGRNEKRRASRFYGRCLTLSEAAYHQGFVVPQEWHNCPKNWRETDWKINLYEAIGNGVPVYMARAFGEALKREAIR